MKILKTRTLRGPNYWSIRRQKLVVMRLDLEDLADQPSDQIPGFYEALVEILPSLEAHFCSPGYRGGFLERVRQGTMMGHIIEHVALELQELTGMLVGFGRTRETSTPGIYQVVFEYLDEQAGRYAARAAVRLCQSIVETGCYPRRELEKDLEDLREIWAEASLGPSTEAIVQAAQEHGIPWLPLASRGLIQLGYGARQQRIQATLSGHTGILGVELASDKEGAKTILEAAGLPVPRGTVIQYLDELDQAIEDVGGFPVVIKPLDGNHGRGITLDIDSYSLAEEAYDTARAISKSVIVERYYPGRDHRVLVVNGSVVAVSERVPAHVVGDGRSPIKVLVEQTNRDPQRGEGHDKVLTRIEINRNTWQLLERQGYDLDTVLPAGEICYLQATANLSTGGIAVDRTDEIHPENAWIAHRAARMIGLDIAGIDIVTPDISQPLHETGGVIVEVNAAPGFRMHTCPSQGTPRNVGDAVLRMLFPPETPSRIPVVAVTGTNGKTTTTRLIAHIFKQTQQTVGYTTTDGIYIDDFLVQKGDTTGPQSAQLILQDPTVEVAVLETARGGILRAGLGFDQCDVGVVLNVQADHLGIGDIDTIEDLADLKAVVAETVHPKGYAVLNADDPLVTRMADRVQAQIAYFTMNPDNERVKAHTAKGGLAAVYENNYLSLLQGERRLRIEQAKTLPLTMDARAPFMIANALAASLAAFAQGVTLEAIRLALKSFQASVGQTPGRMNLFDLGDYHVLVDYAHNPAAYEALAGFVRNWPGERIGVIGGPGDRRDQDLVALGGLSAATFNRLFVKEDDDTRGRERGEVANLITQGILKDSPECQFTTILDETEAIATALDLATPGSLVVVLPESVSRTISLIETHRTLNNDPSEASGAENIHGAGAPVTAETLSPGLPASLTTPEPEVTDPVLHS